MSTDGEVKLDVPLQELASLLDEQPQSLATGSKEVSAAALSAARYLFDSGVYTTFSYTSFLAYFLDACIAISSEEHAAPHLVDLLASLSPQTPPQTRSQTRAISGKRKRDPSPPHPPKPQYERTPVSSLFVDGLNDDQIWAQLELRTSNVWRALSVALAGPGDSFDKDPSLILEPTALDNGDEGMVKRIGDGGGDEDEELEWEDDDTEDDDSEDDDDASEEDEGDEAAASDFGESTARLRDPSNENSDEDEDEEELELEPSSLRATGPSAKRFRSRRRGHPELDDGFFDLAAFNAEIEEAEAKSVSMGSLAKDSDEESNEGDDVDIYTDFDAQDATGEAGGVSFRALSPAGNSYTLARFLQRQIMSTFLRLRCACLSTRTQYILSSPCVLVKAKCVLTRKYG
jgi:U3 small nucleolar RNA-associated protein MPP10